MTRTTYKLSDTRTFGIEIEAYGVERSIVCRAINEAGIDCRDMGYSHDTATYWKLVSDGSIQGTFSFELVSPPLAGADGIRQIETVCRVLNDLGVEVNKSCGLHVHHDANDLTLPHWQNLSKLYLKYEATIDSLMPESRRMGHNHYTNALRSRFSTITEAFIAIDDAESLRGLANTLCANVRYYTLNLTAFWRHGTVEFRHHSGTIDAEKILHWVSLTQCLVVRAMERTRISLKNEDLYGLTAKCWKASETSSRPSNTTIRFYEARQAALAQS